jgi:hypothetical protein
MKQGNESLAMYVELNLTDHQANVDQSKILRKALAVARFRAAAKSDQGEVARVLRRLSDALEMNSQFQEAKELKDEAETIRRGLQGEMYDQLGDTEQSYNTLVYVAFW